MEITFIFAGMFLLEVLHESPLEARILPLVGHVNLCVGGLVVQWLQRDHQGQLEGCSTAFSCDLLIFILLM